MHALVRAAVAALVLATPLAAAAAGQIPLAAGAQAPAIDEPTSRGEFKSDATGKPFVVEFFAVWCPHCQREVPVMNALEKADGARVDVIAIPASPYGFDRTAMLAPADLQTFAQRYGATFRIGFDGFFSTPYDYGVASFPTFFIVGADRRIVAVEAGEVPLERLQADVDRALSPSP